MGWRGTSPSPSNRGTTRALLDWRDDAFQRWLRATQLTLLLLIGSGPSEIGLSIARSRTDLDFGIFFAPVGESHGSYACRIVTAPVAG